MNKKSKPNSHSLASLPSLPSLLCLLLLLGFNTQGISQSTTVETQVGSTINVEMHKMDIPEIGGSINMPSSWSIVTPTDAKLGTENTVYLNEEAKDLAAKTAENIGRQSFKIAKDKEPSKGLNYTLTIAWSPITDPTQVNSVPLEARSEVSSRMLTKKFIPKIKELSRDFSIIEGPTQIDTKGSGSWVTYQEKLIKTEGESGIELEGTLVTRLYLLTKPNYFIIVTLSFPEKDNPKTAKINKDILGEMLKSFQIQNN